MPPQIGSTINLYNNVLNIQYVILAFCIKHKTTINKRTKPNSGGTPPVLCEGVLCSKERSFISLCRTKVLPLKVVTKHYMHKG